MAIHLTELDLKLYPATTGQTLIHNGQGFAPADLPSGATAVHVYNVLLNDIDATKTVFTLNENYKPNTTRVHVNGLRVMVGSEYDYVEISPNQIKFSYTIDVNDMVMIDYIK
jgi:hypothetical protein